MKASQMSAQAKLDTIREYIEGLEIGPNWRTDIREIIDGIEPAEAAPASEYKFEGITVTVAAENALVAYTLLCAGLAAITSSEFITGTYSGPGENEKDIDTSELVAEPA